MSADLLIERIVQPHILACEGDLPVHAAAGRMSAASCSSILIMADGEVEGIWTEHDALGMDFSAPGLFDMPISAVMSHPVKTIHCHSTLGEAAIRFREEGVRHFLVIDDTRRHVGVITQSDVVNNQGIEYFIRLNEISSIVKPSGILPAAGLSLSDAARIMRDRKTDALVVADGNDERGILTERDVLRYISNRRLDDGVWEMASRPVVTLSGSSSLYHARNLFLEKHIRHLGVVGEAGEWLGLITYADILASIEHSYVRELRDALKERDEILNLSNRRLRLAEKVFETTFEGIMVTDTEGVIEFVNDAFSRITGYEAHEVLGRKTDVLSSGRHDSEFYHKMWTELKARGAWQGEIWNRRKDGEIYPEWLSISTIRNDLGAVGNYVAIFSDITERKASDEHVRYLAHHDALTRLPNRMLLMERIEHAMTLAHRTGLKVALMFLDLDRFKIINDTLGHTVGDQLLKTVAERLTACMREDDTVARLGGDEFVVVLEGISNIEHVASVAQKIVDALACPMMLDHHEVFVSASVGISIYPEDGDNADMVIKQADVAMYRAKERGRNNYQFYTADMNTRAFERLTIETSLRRALERDEFRLFYQPQVDLGTRRITGMEALLRWQHPEMGLILPSQFIPIAEETGMIVPIGEWALRTACFQNKAWQDAGMPCLRVSVNLSAPQFKQSNLIKMIGQALQDSGLEACYLELEITESIAMEHAEETVSKLHELKAMGVTISMDDFGTGHSSLSYLKRFPIDTLKIDQSFIQNVALDSHDSAIAAAITTMARSMKIKVVSEGVETLEQVEFLSSHDRDEVQGYYFSHPLPAADFAKLLQRNQPFDQ